MQALSVILVFWEEGDRFVYREGGEMRAESRCSRTGTETKEAMAAAAQVRRTTDWTIPRREHCPAHNFLSILVSFTEDFWPLELYNSELTQVIKWVALSAATGSSQIFT